MSGNLTESFYRLLRESLFSINAGEISLSREEWFALYRTSRRQACSAVVFDAARRLDLPSDLREKWALEVKRIEKRNERMAMVIAKQMAAWDRRGITGVELKGRAVAALYPRPEHRVCGDIDWWFPKEDDWDKALLAAHENGLETVLDSDGDIHYTLGGIVIEHHREGLMENSAEGRIAFLCRHIAKHAMVFGVGMRQICDYALATRACGDSCDRAKIAAFCREMGLGRFLPVLDRAVEVLFASEVTDPADAYIDNTARLFIELVMKDGNFGHDRKHMFSGFLLRLRFFMRCAPGAFFRRWASLFSGHIRRWFTE